MFMRSFAMGCLALMALAGEAGEAVRLYGLTVSSMREPGNVVSPVFGWKMASERPGACQTAYRIRAGEWDGGVVESGVSTGVAYGGGRLPGASRQRWNVCVRDDALPEFVAFAIIRA